MSAMKSDIYQRVTRSHRRRSGAGRAPLAQAVERGACRRAHHAAAARQRAFPISGINVVMLWMRGVERRAYAAPIWMTFKQAIELGAHVRKGENGCLVVYADTHHAHAKPTTTRARRASARSPS